MFYSEPLINSRAGFQFHRRLSLLNMYYYTRLSIRAFQCVRHNHQLGCQDGGVQVLKLISSFSFCYDLNHASLWGDNSLSFKVIKTIIGVPSYHLIILSWKFLRHRIYVRNQSFQHVRNISNIVYRVLYLLDIDTDVNLAATKTPDDQLASYCVIRRILRGYPRLSIEMAINQANHLRTNLHPNVPWT